MRRISLTRGQEAIVDDDDYDYLAQFRWHAILKGHVWYAGRSFGPRSNRVRWLMHRIILAGADRVDHINGDGLDNRRTNLRMASHADNLRNGRKRLFRLGKPTTSPYKGVSWKPLNRKWVARITVDRVERYLGIFDSAEDAARMYDAAALEAFGEFAKVNFPKAA